jgi:hypothetical protein
MNVCLGLIGYTTAGRGLDDDTLHPPGTGLVVILDR